MGDEELTVSPNAFRWQLSLIDLSAIMKAPDFGTVFIINNENNTYLKAPVEVWRSFFMMGTRSYDARDTKIVFVKDSIIHGVKTKMYEMRHPPRDMTKAIKQKFGKESDGLAAVFAQFESMTDSQLMGAGAPRKQKGPHLLIATRFWVGENIKPDARLLHVLNAASGVPAEYGIPLKVEQVYSDGSTRKVVEVLNVSKAKLEDSVFAVPSTHRRVYTETALLLDRKMAQSEIDDIFDYPWHPPEDRKVKVK